MATKSELAAHRDDDPTLNWMMKNDIEPTRENYIWWAHGGKPPVPWTQEHEAELPEPLQDSHKVAQGE